jgi:type II secretory pathway component PulJ
MKRDPGSQRHGTMLHEAVIVTALSSMIVLLGIRLLHQGMTFATESRARIVFRQTCQRLATMFRDDIHEASSVSLEQDGTLRIQFPNNGSVGLSFGSTRQADVGAHRH